MEVGVAPIDTEYTVVFFRQIPDVTGPLNDFKENQAREKWYADVKNRGLVYEEPVHHHKPRRFEGEESDSFTSSLQVPSSIQRVSELMAQGWRPQGGVGVRASPGQSSSGTTSSGITWLYQAMVR